MSERVCIECRNHHVVLEGEQPGHLPRVVECRARPPTVFMLAQNAANLAGKVGVQVNFPASWPQVQALSWCGEFQPKIPGRTIDGACTRSTHG
jgi:hypothetical protein